MAKANGRSNSFGVEPIEQPYGADKGDNSQTSWVTGEIDKKERKWAMFCHLAGLAGLSPLLPAIGSAVAPLIIWQLKADEFPYVAEQGRRAVNFQLSMLLYVTIGTIICLISLVGVFLIPVVFCVFGLIDVIFVLIAAVKANMGRHYRYPFTIRFFKSVNSM
jgi:uncharacterized Tic20 family protein